MNLQFVVLGSFVLNGEFTLFATIGLLVCLDDRALKLFNDNELHIQSSFC